MQYILSANPPTQLQLKLTIEFNDISLSVKSFILCYKYQNDNIRFWTLLWQIQLSSSSNLWPLLDICGTNVLPAQYWHVCVMLSFSVCKSREQRARAESKSTEHKIKMQFFPCYNTLFFKQNISICYNINVLYCCISKFKFHNKTKKIAISLIQHFFVWVIFTRTHILQPGHPNSQDTKT